MLGSISFSNAALLLLLTTSTSAQILSTGNTSPPSCAQSCPILNQAVAACSGQTTSDQSTWICFCQSGYLTALLTTSAGQVPVGICDDVCVASDVTKLQNWYTGNCGTDHGASEHAGQATTAGSPTTTAAATTGTSTSTATSGTSGSVSAGDVSSTDGSAAYTGTWWSSHYQWIIMLFVILVGLGLLAFLLVWLKRRHDKKQDTVTGGFNEGITMRSAPPATFTAPSAPHSSSGRDSPVRTREAFMPYGYGYARSESRLGSRTNVAETQNSYSKGSPLAHDGTTISDLEKTQTHAAGGGKKKVYVSERSMREAEDPEKTWL